MTSRGVQAFLIKNKEISGVDREKLKAEILEVVYGKGAKRGTNRASHPTSH